MDWLTAPDYGILCGTITDEKGKPADGAVVVTDDPEWKKVLADGSGFFAFTKIAPGKKLPLIVEYGGKITTTDFDVKAGKVTELKIKLK